MAILNPEHLLEQAERLLSPRTRSTVIRQADRRRAISAAYYAAFHLVLTAVADEFVGPANRKKVRYALAYRSVDHGSLEALCKEVIKQTLREKYLRYVTGGTFGDKIREFASLILELKEKRTSADYDPSHWTSVIDARTAMASAKSAIEQFQGAPVQKKKAFLTLLVFPPR
ncbi:MAG: hypothetical protein KGZ65_03515 [Sphingomonadales bacterium]|nr:hypothetical protein [Sphingomonadaceae bacterium]MBS3930278.1 hypothetical protein [Sphingomonadales bacterium]